MPEPSANRIVFRATAGAGERRPLCDILAAGTGLPKLRIKNALQKGAVWLKRRGAGERRVRRATFVPRPGDEIGLWYDERLLAAVAPAAVRLHDAGRYSVWHKPPGMTTQGSRYGDHCALLRQAERLRRPERPVFLVHRLDREACGLVLLAHDPQAAAALSQLFAERRITKRYRLKVRGIPQPAARTGRIELPLDGRPAVTDYRVVATDPHRGTATVEAVMQTGRKHQLRRHFEQIGHPVMGDPRYGKGNKNTAGLQLAAVGLEFTCPFSGARRVFRTDARPTPAPQPGGTAAGSDPKEVEHVPSQRDVPEP
jgi:tRNA pseudouridine32 synthase/23S rRNA pseudouridine746 synthase